ncbi:hypothetical protein LTR33_001196 [Friedmanniomyces endolithicus]|nr:hypothetical protein LTR33_001196 [Friedmanniomyces endolithicus]
MSLFQCTHPHDSSLKIPKYIFSTTRTATNLHDLSLASQWPPENQSPWTIPDSNDEAEDIHWRYHTNEPITARDELTDANSVPTNPFKKVYDLMAINSLMEYRVDASQTRARGVAKWSDDMTDNGTKQKQRQLERKNTARSGVSHRPVEISRVYGRTGS